MKAYETVTPRVAKSVGWLADFFDREAAMTADPWRRADSLCRRPTWTDWTKGGSSLGPRRFLSAIAQPHPEPLPLPSTGAAALRPQKHAGD